MPWKSKSWDNICSIIKILGSWKQDCDFFSCCKIYFYNKTDVRNLLPFGGVLYLKMLLLSSIKLNTKD